jgi:type III secretory pathway component EscS
MMTSVGVILGTILSIFAAAVVVGLFVSTCDAIQQIRDAAREIRDELRKMNDRAEGRL